MMLKSYLKNIAEIAGMGDAREESYYSSLEKLLNEYATRAGKSSIHITSLPKQTEAGNPDFRVWDGKQHIVGYIEAKAPAVEDLNKVEHSDQLKRYLHTFPNVILTNFFEFRLYRNGELIDKVLIARPFIARALKTIPPVEKETDFLSLLEKFFLFSLPKVHNAKVLAVELAKRTRFLRDEVIAEELREEEKTGKAFIHGFYEAFKQYLISGLTKEEFADLYSQTITYGLFAARTRTENGFSRKTAYDNIPHTIGILRDLFRFISLGEPPQQMEWIIDDISEVLEETGVKNILRQYFHEGKGSDPIVHFYETFLAEYDPAMREKRGVYYTPEPVVSYIVRSLHTILKEQFGRVDGLADASVTVLDPAGGTLTFLAEAAKLAVEEFVSKYGEGGKARFIKDHILQNFYAFELMMAPYAIGHLKMSFLLEELGHKLARDERFKLYLTNTLEMEELPESQLPGMSSLSEESHLAGKVKKDQPILVILGNPPYSGHSSNIGVWISKEIKAYYEVDGKPLGEKNPKWLQDDYVKFLRFAQWKIDQAGEGLLGFITNHSYLDNPTFRGMRQSLMKSFDELYLLDLHGNSLKKEKCPDGSKDENVFDIQQGVAIAILIKRKGKKEGSKIFHSEAWGLREQKYARLSEQNVKTTEWCALKPSSTFYLFVPRDDKLAASYERYPRINEIFPVNSVGIVTSRDDFVIDVDREKLKRRIVMFRDNKVEDEIIREAFHLADTTNWKMKEARNVVRKDNEWEDSITQILYRPFDTRWICYHDALIERSRLEVMRHMLKENLGFVFMRQAALDSQYSHCFVSPSIVDNRAFYSSKGIMSIAPLYVYQGQYKPKKQSGVAAMMLFEPETMYESKKPNLNPELVTKLAKDFKHSPTPEQVFYYIYAVLYSNIYRTKYSEFLKIDFPRIPFTKDYRLFLDMTAQGELLVSLHLLKSQTLNNPVTKFQGTGSNKIEQIKYDPLPGSGQPRVYINKEQYFEGVLEEVWAYQIGGYQVCDKWLKDRKERVLSLEDIKHYCRVVTAIVNTIEIQEHIDAIYPKIEREFEI
jgi:predicted helicase